MRILHIETGRHLYGGALQVLYLLKGLKERGVKNTLVCPRESEIGIESRDSALIHEIPFASEIDLSFLLRLYLLMNSERPDIIHIHSRRGADLWGGLAARLAKIPAIITRRVDNPESALAARFKYSMYRHVVTISEGIQKVLIAEGLKPEKITLIHSAVDLDRYKTSGDMEWFHREFGLSAENMAIGTVAQFIPRKGHRYIIESVPKILERFPGARFLFFGQGPLKNELQAFCRKTGIDNRVYFAGFRTDLEKILPCLDILLHPASMEGLGVSLLQAAASGVPIIGARTGGIPEVVNHGVNGYLIEPADTQAIVDSVVSLLQDPEKRRRLGMAGRQKVETSFSISTMVEAYLTLYDKLITN
ncbi:MAG: glycosyltransferase family 4 protein [Deltaproteobacteria bacterium]|nr:glycosyltransferase family 4 protein [Deltaproteobacteria bacterium]